MAERPTRQPTMTLYNAAEHGGRRVRGDALHDVMQMLMMTLPGVRVDFQNTTGTGLTAVAGWDPIQFKLVDALGNPLSLDGDKLYTLVRVQVTTPLLDEEEQAALAPIQAWRVQHGPELAMSLLGHHMVYQNVFEEAPPTEG